MIRKINAMFMVFLLISFSFTLYVPEVSAANVDTCGMTEDGNYCVESGLNEGFASYDGCAAGHLFTGQSSEDVAECKTGTCVPKAGGCLANYFKVQCVNEDSGGWYEGALNSVPDCQVGCCSYSNSLCSLEEKKFCVHDIAKDDASAFLGTAYTIDTCNDQCRSAELGCYKFPSGGCDYGTREQFSSQTGYVSANFYSDKFCSDIIECFTDKETYVGCGDGTTDDDNLDVYNFDSALNREGMKIDCGYPEGMCYDPDGAKGEDAYCKSTNCVSGLEEYAQPGNFKSGESLCINIAPYHYTNDARSTGLKPYILSCQYGDIVADASIVDRSVICIEEKDDADRLHAKTINNYNECHACGTGGSLLGQAGDIFGYLVPPLSSIGLLTTEPCKGDGGSWVLNGDKCSIRGKVGDIEMCGYGPLDTSDSYDSDLWAPIGSCNPIYPPSGDHCGECGRGGDAILNTCTIDECNSLGDCKFVKQNVNLDSFLTAGGVWVGTCTSLFLLSRIPIPIPGANEALTSTAAKMCTWSAGKLSGGAIAVYLATVLGLSVGASIGTSESQIDKVGFELTNDGKAKLSDIVIAGKNIEDNYGLVGFGLTSGSFLYLIIAENIFKNNGFLTELILKELVVDAIQKGFEEYLIDKGILLYSGGEVTGFSYPLLEKYKNEVIKNYDVEVYNSLSEQSTDLKNYNSAKEILKEKAVEENLKKASIVTKLMNSLGILFNVYSLSKSFNPGKCVPETPYTSNEKCELCGPGEGQWFCTEERCNVLGGSTGHCKWVPKDTAQTDGMEDGLCIPLDVTDASAPVITKVNITLFDSNGIEWKSYTVNDNKLEINDLIDWNVTVAEITIETNEEGECGFTKTAQSVYKEGTTSFDYPSPLFQTIHTTNVSFVEADKANPNGIYIYFKCMDINENKLVDDNNYIQLKFAGRPDTEPPIIKYINPQSVFLPEDTTSITLEIHAYDENGVGRNGGIGVCKYSETTTNFVDMTAFTYGNTIDCVDMVVGNAACDKFTTTVDVSTGGTTIDFSSLTGANDNLQGIQNMRTYFYSIKCSDNGNNIMYDSLNWSLTIVPSYDLDVNGPMGDVYDLTPEFNVSTTNPTTCYYTLNGEPTEYYFEELYSYNHNKEHNETLMPNTYSYLVHCEDFGGNIMEGTGSFNVKVIPLNIISIEPNNTNIYTNSYIFEAVTEGGWYDNGNSTCKYKETTNYQTKNFDSMNTFEDKEVLSTQTTHEANVTFSQGGEKQYYILCRDEMGSQGNVYIQDETFVEINVDFANPPIIIGLYTTSTTLNLILNENGICTYSTDNINFNFDEGNSMVPEGYSSTKSIALGSGIYYIKCEDSYGNVNENNPYIIYP